MSILGYEPIIWITSERLIFFLKKKRGVKLQWMMMCIVLFFINRSIFFFLVLRCIFCNEQRMSFDETNRLFSSRTSPSQSMVNDQMKTLCTRGVRLGVRSLI